MTPTPLHDLTPRQRAVLLWIAGHVQRYGYGPTIREGQAAFGMKSPHGFRTHALALASKGLVTSDARLCRSLRLADGVTVGDDDGAAVRRDGQGEKQHGGASDGSDQRRARAR
jgi:repressor LexA